VSFNHKRPMIRCVVVQKKSSACEEYCERFQVTCPFPLISPEYSAPSSVTSHSIAHALHVGSLPHHEPSLTLERQSRKRSCHSYTCLFLIFALSHISSIIRNVSERDLYSKTQHWRFERCSVTDISN
jgi:hypothetical protein